MRVASEVGNLPSKFGHARPFGSRIIRYVRDGRRDGPKQRLLPSSLRAGRNNLLALVIECLFFFPIYFKKTDACNCVAYFIWVNFFYKNTLFSGGSMPKVLHEICEHKKCTYRNYTTDERQDD